MNTQYFKYVIEIERTRSITQAADKLFIAQPNLSKAIREMEYSLGFQIFTRTSKGVIPTPKGKLFIEHAHKIIRQLEEIEKLNTQDAETVLTLELDIPRADYISNGVISFASSLDAKDGLDISIRECSAVQTVRDVAEGLVSLGIIRYRTDFEIHFRDYLWDNGLQNELLWEFECVALMSKDNPNANLETLSMKKLRDGIEIVCDDESVPYTASDRPINSAESMRRRIAACDRADQLELLAKVPGAYILTSPVTEDTLARYDLVQRKLYGDVPKMRDLIVSRKNKHYTDTEKQLINAVFESKNRVAFSTYS
jgi:DNA-binding transcriptional LysR family regulator